MHFEDACQVDTESASGFQEDFSQAKGTSNQIRTTDDLGTAFSRIGQEIQVGSQVRFRIVLEGRTRPLHPVVYDHAYTIGREALLNAFRHSEATRVDLHLEHTPARLCMTIRDNGRGMSGDQLCTGCNGLSWIKNLAERMGGRLKLLSRAKAGTEVLLSIPGHLAFAAEITVRRKLAAA